MLPFSRNRNYTTGTPVDPNDMDDLQDYIIALYVGTRHFGAISLSQQQINAHVSGGIASPDWVFEYYGQNMRSVINTGAKVGQLDITPYLYPGVVIHQIKWRWINGVTPSAGTIDFFAGYSDVDSPLGAQTTISTLASQNSSTGGASAERTATDTIDHTVLANKIYGIGFETNAAFGDDQAGIGAVSLILTAP